LKRKNNIPKYIDLLFKYNPKIFSGRKNFKEQHKRIIKTLNLIKAYKKTNN